MTIFWSALGSSLCLPRTSQQRCVQKGLISIHFVWAGEGEVASFTNISGKVPNCGPPLYSDRILVSSVTSILRSMAFLKNFAWKFPCLFRSLNPLRAKNLWIHYSLTSPSNNFEKGTTIHFTTAVTIVYPTYQTHCAKLLLSYFL